MMMKSENCLYCHCAEGCVYIFDDKEPCPLIELEEEEGIPRTQYLRWIPCTERLPEEKINHNTRDFEEVLCTTIWGDVRSYKYGKPFGHDKAHFWHGCGIIDDEEVIAWMPLPEPYRGGGKVE